MVFGFGVEINVFNYLRSYIFVFRGYKILEYLFFLFMFLGFVKYSLVLIEYYFFIERGLLI